MAARLYPEGFDWRNTVISALASWKHNPAGAGWFAGALALAMALLWPVVVKLAPITGESSQGRWFASATFRVGVVCAVLIGAERLLFPGFSQVLRKGHEALALVAFLGFYGGVLATYVRHVWAGSAPRWPVILVLVPLVAAGTAEAILYIIQRDVGWAGHDWRGAGTPWWLRFAVWQWLALGVLWTALGHLLHLSRRATPTPVVGRSGGSPQGE